MKNKKKILIICFLVNFLCVSQENVTINYIDSEIKNLIELAQIKNSNTKIYVYSIQLKASEIPEKITKIKKKYSSLFPSETIDEIFESPYFKLIIGVYLDKKKAEKKLKEIQKKFKSAFVLRREISVEKFKESRQK